jgi:hypothetical protein
MDRDRAKKLLAGFDRDRVWCMLKGVFVHSARRVPANTLRELLEVEDADERVVGKVGGVGGGRGVGRKNNTLQHRLLYENAEQQQRQRREINYGMVSEILGSVAEEMNLIFDFIEGGVLPPTRHLPLRYEYNCMIIRNTLMRDDWYECGQKTNPARGPYVSQLSVALFSLQLVYRLWGRRSLIFDPPAGEESPSGPVWYNRVDFCDGSFPVLDDEEKLAPLREWGPTKVYRALLTLFQTRQRGVVNFERPASLTNFDAYREGLLDMVCIQCLLPVPGTPEEISEAHAGGWFRLTTERIKDAGVVRETEVNEGFKAISREIREHQVKDLEKKKARLVVQSSDGDTRSGIAKNHETKAQRFDERRKKDLSDNLVRMNAALIRLRINLHNLRTGGTEGENDGELFERQKRSNLEADEEDRIAAEKIEKQIDEIEKAIIAQRQAEETATQKENARLIETALQENSFLTAAAARTNKQSFAKPAFIQEIMLLYDHISNWLYPVGGEMADMFTLEHMRLRQVLKDDIVRALASTSENKVISKCHEWIISRDVDFYEREAYRQGRSEGAIFNTIDVCTYVRGPEHVRYLSFPTDLTELIYDADCEFYYRAWNYFVWWYCVQKLPSIKVDSTIFLWDLEMYTNSLERPRETASPIMAQSGYNWVVVRKGPWVNPATSDLNGMWSGRYCLDALTVWVLELAKNDWVINDRVTGKSVSLAVSHFRDLFSTARNLDNQA